MTEDKMAAYQTLHTCLNTIAIISSPIAPFYMDQLYQDLNGTTESVHLTDYPSINSDLINKELEAQMQIAQRTSSMVLGLRKKENLRVRQPLQKIMVPALDETFAANLLHVKELILAEVNVKELELLGKDNDVLVKSIKPNFKTIGPKYGKQMKSIAAMVSGLKGDDIATIESNGGWKGEIDGTSVELDMNDFEIVAQDIPGWTVSSDGNLTVALDVTLTDELKSEGIARELVNRVQNLRKDSGLEVTDRILLKVDTNELIKNAIVANKEYVCNEVLANDVQFETLSGDALVTDLVEAEDAKIGLVKA
jgi:isoleucyl-tRNA synthetase